MVNHRRIKSRSRPSVARGERGRKSSAVLGLLPVACGSTPMTGARRGAPMVARCCSWPGGGGKRRNSDGEELRCGAGAVARELCGGAQAT